MSTEQSNRCAAQSNDVDPTLIGALENAKQKMLYQVEGLETKFVNAEARRNEVMERQLDLLVNSLFPIRNFRNVS